LQYKKSDVGTYIGKKHQKQRRRKRKKIVQSKLSEQKKYGSRDRKNGRGGVQAGG